MAQHDPLQRSHAYEDIFLPVLQHWCLGIAFTLTRYQQVRHHQY